LDKAIFKKFTYSFKYF
jgi:hypothetical protein